MMTDCGCGGVLKISNHTFHKSSLSLQHAILCSTCVLGHDTEHVPVQKTVPLVSTPADAELEQHEVSHGC
jgi:hypothetical protein